ncbi:histidine kinase, partial [Stenotrophomonas maltophilia]
VWDGVVWDITANKQIELELGESRAQLRELSAHLESVREEEKARIAREVHDELGQVLTVLKLETSMCELAYA